MAQINFNSTAMSNTSKNDSKIDDDDEINTKYQPPKVVPLKEILNQDSEDASLNKYKEKLIGTAINVIIGKLYMRLFVCF